MAMIQVPRSKNESTSPRFNALAIRPPTTAPTIPITVVMMMPPGSSPGMIALAMRPATRPSRIQPRMPIFPPSGRVWKLAGGDWAGRAAGIPGAPPRSNAPGQDLLDHVEQRAARVSRLRADALEGVAVRQPVALHEDAL